MLQYLRAGCATWKWQTLVFLSYNTLLSLESSAHGPGGTASSGAAWSERDTQNALDICCGGAVTLNAITAQLVPAAEIH
jgi:hypothetical protein